MSIKNKQTVKKNRNITFSAIVKNVHEIDNIVIETSDGRFIKAKINPTQKEGNAVVLVPKIGSTISVKKRATNSEYIITDAGLNCDEYNVIEVLDETSGDYVVIAKDEVSNTVLDLNLD